MKGIYFVALILITFPSAVYATIVNPKEIYTYESLKQDMLELSDQYPNLITNTSLATTSYGRNIWAMRVGNGNTSILLHGAHHAREWMTSALLMKMAETYAEAYKDNQKVDGFQPEILDEVSIWFVPMVNPDGVTLQQLGLYAFPTYIHTSLIEMNEGSMNFKRWKANVHGVDLNRQYPANWESLKGVHSKPNYQFYKGSRPLEANEVKALVDFTYETKPEIAVSYHSSGNVLFWGIHHWGLTHTTIFTHDYYSIAEKVSDITNYPIEEPEFHQQGGGFTDWFVEEFNKPALTVEIGSLIEDNSLPLVAFPQIWERNRGIGLLLAKKALERKESIYDCGN